MRKTTLKVAAAGCLGLAMTAATVGGGVAAATTESTPAGSSHAAQAEFPTKEIDAILNKIIADPELTNAELLTTYQNDLARFAEQIRGPGAPLEYKGAVDGVVSQIGYAKKKIGTPEYHTIADGLRQQADKALHTPH